MENVEPQTERERLLQYLRAKAEEQNMAAPEMAAIQQQANQQQALAGIAEGANTILQGSLGNKVDPNAFASARAANQQVLQDYLARRQAERNKEYDKFQAVKELSDLEQAKERAALDAKRMEQQARLTAEAIRDRKEARDANLELRERGMVQKIYDKFDKEGITEAETVIPKIEDMLAKVPAGENIPGFGEVVSSLPDIAVSKEGQQNRLLLETLAAPIRKANFGTAQSASEAKNFLRQIGSGNVTPETLRLGVKLQKELVEQRKQKVFQSDPKAAEVFLKNQAPATQLMEASAPTPAPKKRSKADIQAELDKINAQLQK